MSLTLSLTTISRVVTGSGQRVYLVGEKQSRVDEQSRYRHRNSSLSLTAAICHRWPKNYFEIQHDIGTYFQSSLRAGISKEFHSGWIASHLGSLARYRGRARPMLSRSHVTKTDYYCIEKELKDLPSITYVFILLFCLIPLALPLCQCLATLLLLSPSSPPLAGFTPSLVALPATLSPCFKTE